MKKWQKELVRLVGPLLKKVGPEHDLDHTERVFKYCSIFSKSYREVDMEVLFAAAYLHDLGYFLKNKKGRNHSHLVLTDAVLILKKAKAPGEKLDLMKQIIKYHSAREDLSKMKLPVEVLIFHDADKMDSMGALGLARQFVYSGRIGRKIWDPQIKRNAYLPYGGDFSAMHTILDHQLKYRLYTKEAKKIAKDRKKYMRTFIKRFFQEWDFKK